GPVLLAGFVAGKVPREAVTRAMDSLIDLKRSYGGRCIPYSNSPYDFGKSCVWNVHFGAADWVLRASRATRHRWDDATKLAEIATSWRSMLKQNPVTGYWPYTAKGGAPQDIGHQLWTAVAVDSLVGTREATRKMLAGPLWRQQAARFRDDNVAGAVGSIALLDCTYAVDQTVLAYAPSTPRATPYVRKAISSQATAVLRTCFTDLVAKGRVTARTAQGPIPIIVPLG